MSDQFQASQTEKISQDFEGRWFIQRGARKLGPWTASKIIQELQSKNIFSYDLLWKEGGSLWQRLSECKEFSAHKISTDFIEKKRTDLFIQRQSSRIHFCNDLIIHNQNEVWSGKSFSLSENGMGLVVENALLLPGQFLFIHFKPYKNYPAFNVQCEIVSKAFSRDVKTNKSPVSYGVVFKKTSEEAKQLITKILNENKKNSELENTIEP